MDDDVCGNAAVSKAFHVLSMQADFNCLMFSHLEDLWCTKGATAVLNM